MWGSASHQVLVFFFSALSAAALASPSGLRIRTLDRASVCLLVASSSIRVRPCSFATIVDTPNFILLVDALRLGLTVGSLAHIGRSLLRYLAWLRGVLRR